MSAEIDINELKSGDERAFRQFVDAYGKSIFNLCINIVTNTEDAEDLAQETFIEAYNSITSFRETAQLKTWLYRIAINKCYDYLRWKKRKKRFALLQPLFNRDEEPIEIPSNFQHPGIVLDNKETAQILFAAMESLPDNQQTAFVLYETQGMDYKQIAETMNVSISAVEALLFRARANLRKKLEKYYTKSTSYKKH
ncbi:MAG TPA: RNA polymerase sigma factor [Bacteroidia bacterium]|nr:RNA polymerase sigma factor [Bacteroidia bacterium]